MQSRCAYISNDKVGFSQSVFQRLDRDVSIQSHKTGIYSILIFLLLVI